MDLNLKGKIALVTGASKGIGLVFVSALAAEGCDLHLAARDKTALQQAAKRLRSERGVKVTVHGRDLARAEEVEALGEICKDVDILINNAGDIPPGTLAEVDSKTWRESWSVKVFGYVDLTRVIYPRMCQRKSGVIINIVGAAARNPNHRYIAGCSANIALNTFTQCLGGESLAPRCAGGGDQSRADGSRQAPAARYGTCQPASRRREPLAGTPRQFPGGTGRQGRGSGRAGLVPRLRPCRLY